ncbi:MAG: translation initiation factor 2 [Eubacteriales bacterium]
MVKGSTRQIILVKSPHKELFEEAIFVVREEAAARSGMTSEALVAKAQKLANDYLHRDDFFYSTAGVHGGVWALLGASVASIVWGLVYLLF